VRAAPPSLRPLTPALALALGTLSLLPGFLHDMLSPLRDADLACLAGAGTLAVAFGLPIAWATARLTSRRWLVAWLLFPALALGTPALAFVLRRAVELEQAIVTGANFGVAAAIGLGLAVFLHARLGRRGVTGWPRWALASAMGMATAVACLLLGQRFPGVAVTGAALGVGALALVLLARGTFGWPAPTVVALVLVVGLGRIEPSYFSLRLSVLVAGAGAAVLAGREWLATRPAPRRRRAEVATVALVWLACAILGERIVRLHPPVYRARADLSGAMSAALEGVSALLDVDRDGHAPFFFGRDCAPFDRTRSPGMHEVPGNGRDDDCTAGDATGDSSSFIRAELAKNPRPPRFQGDVIVVVVDTLRADAAGPALSAFASKGRRFSRAYASASFTAQSLVGILTGNLPTAATYTFHSHHDAEVTSLPPTLFRALGGVGFSTGVAGGVRGRLFARFFGEAEVVRPLGMNTPAAETTATAIETFRALDPRKPRLLYVHYLALHRTRDRALYFELARELDHELGVLFAALGDQALWVITGDHGESFGEHGARGHSTVVYRDVLEVPLVVRYPGIEAGEVGFVTSLLGLSPTIVGMVAPELLRGERGPFFCLGQPACGDVLAPAALEKPRTHLHSLIEGRRHAFHDLLRDRTFTFDLDADPGELHPLAARSSRLERWEQHAFVDGAAVSWF